MAPCSKEYVSSHYLEVVADISKIKKYNWAEFTLEYLLTNLAEFKKNKRSGLVGALLQVIFILFIFLGLLLELCDLLTHVSSISPMIRFGTLNIFKHMEMTLLMITMSIH